MIAHLQEFWSSHDWDFTKADGLGASNPPKFPVFQEGVNNFPLGCFFGDGSPLGIDFQDLGCLGWELNGFECLESQPSLKNQCFCASKKSKPYLPCPVFFFQPVTFSLSAVPSGVSSWSSTPKPWFSCNRQARRASRVKRREGMIHKNYYPLVI